MSTGWLSSAKLRLKALFHRPRLDRDLDDELAFHLALREEQLRAAGPASPANDAASAARRRFGNTTLIKEDSRALWTFPSLESFWQDVRFGARMLRRNPGFTAVAVLTLALGIGANTAIFSVVDAVLLRPLPFADPDRVVVVWEDAGFMGFPRNTPAPANYLDWKRRNHVFSDMAATSDSKFDLDDPSDPEIVPGSAVTWNTMSLLGVAPILGRSFTGDEDRPGADKVVLLSHGLWERRFGADPGVVGREIRANGEMNRVVGVMPPGFHFPDRDAEMWKPLALAPQQWQERTDHYLRVIARLKPGVSLHQARSEMSLLARHLAQEYPVIDPRMGIAVLPLREQYAGSARRGLLVLLAAVACVLLIVCANLANLILARATRRMREIAVRTALGARRLRIARQLLTENLLLAGAGALFGVLLARWSFSFLIQLVPAEFAPSVPIQLEPRILAFTLFAAVCSALLFGMAPAAHLARLQVSESLKAGDPRSGFGGRGGLRGSLVVTEVALTLILLVSASLLFRSFANLRGQDPGFRPDRVLTLRLTLPPFRYPDAPSRAAFFEQVVEKLRALPGVRAVGFTSALPLVWKGGTAGFAVEGGLPPSSGLPYDANDRVVSPEYMQVMGMTLRAGRFFQESDGPDSQPVVIINETLARMYFPGRNALGSRMKYDDNLDPQSPWCAIIGIVQDVKAMGLDLPARPEMYFVYRQAFHNWMTPRDIVIRAAGDPLLLAAAARQRIWEVDPRQPVSNVATLDDILDQEVLERRVQTTLLACFAALAIVLACVGLYGVLSFRVSQRVQEIGLRLALGAHPRQILSQFVARGLALALAGVALGLAGAFALTRALASLLFGVEPHDPLIFLSVPAIVLIVAFVASLIPARRAMRIAPMEALRHE